MPILMLLILLGSLALAPSSAQADAKQRTLFEAPTELLSDDAGLRARTFDEIEALGVRDVRVILYWQAVAPAAESSETPGFIARDARVRPATRPSSQAAGDGRRKTSRARRA